MVPTNKQAKANFYCKMITKGRYSTEDVVDEVQFKSILRMKKKMGSDWIGVAAFNTVETIKVLIHIP